jgi:signal transduction histidine kinase
MSTDFILDHGSDGSVKGWHQDVIKSLFDVLSADITLLEAVRDKHHVIIDFRYLTIVRKALSTSDGNATDNYLFKNELTANEKELFASLVKLINGEKAINHVYQVKPENSDRWFQLQVKMVEDIVIVFKEDITTIREDRDKIRHLNHSLELKGRELELLNSELRTFANVAAHDYSETLRNLYTNLEFIIGSDGSKLSNAGKANVRRAQAAIQKLKLLTDDIIAYSKISASYGELALVDLVDIVSSVVENLKPRITQSDVAVKTEVLPIIQGYPSLLRVLFNHLIDNAIKFRKDHSEHVVHIKAEQIEGSAINNPNVNRDSIYFVVKVSDNGIGFLPEDEEKIFEMFYRVHEKKYRGSGIGLPICKKIMDIHGGFITAKCNPECTEFSCYFPIKWDL